MSYPGAPALADSGHEQASEALKEARALWSDYQRNALTIARRLQHGVAFARKIAAYDLTGEIQAMGGDEIGELGHSLLSIRDGLRGIINQMAVLARGLDRSIASVREGSKWLSASSQSSAVGLEETSSALNTIKFIRGRQCGSPGGSWFRGGGR